MPQQSPVQPQAEYKPMMLPAVHALSKMLIVLAQENPQLKSSMNPIVKCLIKDPSTRDNSDAEVIDAHIRKLAIPKHAATTKLHEKLELARFNATRELISEMLKLYKKITDITYAELDDLKQANGVDANRQFQITTAVKNEIIKFCGQLGKIIYPSHLNTNAEVTALISTATQNAAELRKKYHNCHSDEEIINHVCKKHNDLAKSCKIELAMNRTTENKLTIKQIIDKVFKNHSNLRVQLFTQLKNARANRIELAKIATDQEIQQQIRQSHHNLMTAETVLEKGIPDSKISNNEMFQLLNAQLNTIFRTATATKAVVEDDVHASPVPAPVTAEDEEEQEERLVAERLAAARRNRHRPWVNPVVVQPPEESEEEEEEEVKETPVERLAVELPQTEQQADHEEEQKEEPAQVQIISVVPEKTAAVTPPLSPIEESPSPQAAMTAPVPTIVLPADDLSELARKASAEDAKKKAEAAAELSALKVSPKLLAMQELQNQDNNLRDLLKLLRDNLFTQGSLNFWQTQIVGKKRSLVSKANDGHSFDLYPRVLREDCGDYLPARQTVPAAIFDLVDDFSKMTVTKVKYLDSKTVEIEESVSAVSANGISSSAEKPLGVNIYGSEIIFAPHPLNTFREELSVFLALAANADESKDNYSEKHLEFAAVMKDVSVAVEADKLTDATLAEIEDRLKKIVTPLTRKQLAAKIEEREDANNANRRMERLATIVDVLEMIRQALKSPENAQFWSEQTLFGGGVQLKNGTSVPSHIARMLAILDSPAANGSAEKSQLALLKIIEIARETENLRYCMFFSKPLSRTKATQNFYKTIANLAMQSFTDRTPAKLNTQLLKIDKTLVHPHYPVKQPHVRARAYR
jgi:hypothetical protein